MAKNMERIGSGSLNLIGSPNIVPSVFFVFRLDDRSVRLWKFFDSGSKLVRFLANTFFVNMYNDVSMRFSTCNSLFNSTFN